MEAKIRTELAQGNFGILKPKVVPSLKQFLNDEFLPYTEGRFKESPKTLDYYPLGVKMLDESQHIAEFEFSEYLMAYRQPWRDAALVIYFLGFRPGEVFTLR